MTAGKEWKQVLLFSVPILIGNLLQQLYNTVDGIVVGNYVSQSALGALGSCTELALVFLALAVGLSIGSSILVSQFFGARRYDELKRAASTALILLISIGAAASVAGSLGARFLLEKVMAVEAGKMLDLATSYFRVYAIGLVLQFTYNIIAAILRAIGDSRATLYFLCISVGVNLLLDLLFVIVFGWGVAGAAAATVIAELICVIASCVYMRRKHELFRYKKGEFVFDGKLCLSCLRLGVPTTLQHCALSFGTVLVMRLVNSFGEFTMSACMVGNRIQFYSFIPAQSFSAGMSMFAGQNIGAGKTERATRGLRATLVISFLICLAISSFSYAFAAPFASAFGLSGEALDQAVQYVRFVAFFLIIMTVYLPMAGMLQGAGDVSYAMMCTMTSLVVRVIAAYAMAGALDMGYSSIWKSMPVGWSVCFTMALIRILGGKWKQKAVVRPAGPVEGGESDEQ